MGAFEVEGGLRGRGEFYMKITVSLDCLHSVDGQGVYSGYSVIGFRWVSLGAAYRQTVSLARGRSEGGPQGWCYHQHHLNQGCHSTWVVT